MAPNTQCNTSQHSQNHGFQKLRQCKINFKKKNNERCKNLPFIREELSEQNCKQRKSRKINSLKLAQAEYHNIRRKRLEKKEEVKRKKAEREAALSIYKRKKQLKNKKLMAKTSKGQPIMKNRIEMLLENIQSTIVKK